MSAKRQAAKRDANEPEIIAALTEAGCSVQALSDSGVPDLLVGYIDIDTGEPRNVLIEVKNGKYAKLTDDQEKWHAAWVGQKAVVRSADEALQLVGRMDKPQAIEVAEPITVAAIEPEVVSVDVATTEPAAKPDIKLLPAPELKLLPPPEKHFDVGQFVYVIGAGMGSYEIMEVRTHYALKTMTNGKPAYWWRKAEHITLFPWYEKKELKETG